MAEGRSLDDIHTLHAPLPHLTRNKGIVCGGAGG